MKYTNLGNTQVKTPVLWQGTTGLGSYKWHDPEKVRARIKMIRYGIENDLNFIDTGDLYGGGFVEETLGKEFKNIRDRLFIATKCNPRISIEKSIIESLINSLN